MQRRDFLKGSLAAVGVIAFGFVPERRPDDLVLIVHPAQAALFSGEIGYYERVVLIESESVPELVDPRGYPMPWSRNHATA